VGEFTDVEARRTEKCENIERKINMRELVFVGRQKLEWHEATDPRIQDDRQAVVRPIASTTCDLDQRIIAGFSPFHPPFAIGHECVAEVVEVGSAVKTVKRGDIVVVPWKPACGECAYCRAGLTASCETYGFLGAYGLPLGANLGGLFSDLVLVPFADAMLVVVPDEVDPIAVASVGDNLTDSYISVSKGLTRHPKARVLVLGGIGSLGPYAVDHALAAGAESVDYIDKDPVCREIAQSFGATVHESYHDTFLMQYPVVICASRELKDVQQLFQALAPGGHFSMLAIFFEDKPIPLWEMYQRDVTFSTGKPSTRPFIPAVLELCRCGQLHPERVVSKVIPWEMAAEGLVEPSLKPVVVRQPVYSNRILKGIDL